jgi:hypothetical protein
MKKKFYFIGILFLSFTAFSQVPGGFSLLVGGQNTNFNSSSISTKPGIGYKYGISWFGGYHETYNFQIDLNQSLNAVGFDYSNGIDNGNGKQTLETTDLSLYVNYYIIKPDEDKFYAGFGAGVFTTFSGGNWEEKDTFPDNSVYTPSDINSTTFQNFSKFNYGPSFGVIAGYNNFKLGIKYNLGLSNVLKNVTTQSPSEDGSSFSTPYVGKLNSLSLCLYYQIFANN